MKRAERRHHKNRLITKCVTRLKRWWFPSQDDLISVAKKQVDNRKVCSNCLCCGNPRKMWKEPTLAEKRVKLSEKEYYQWLEEYEMDG